MAFCLLGISRIFQYHLATKFPVPLNKAAIQTQCAAVLVHSCHPATDGSLDIDQSHVSTQHTLPTDSTAN